MGALGAYNPTQLLRSGTEIMTELSGEQRRTRETVYRVQGPKAGRVVEGGSNDAYALTAVAATLREGLTFTEWLLVGRRLLGLVDASAWWIGDWLAYGGWRYGTKYRIAVEHLQLNYDRIRDYAYVSARVGHAVRRPDLSFRHHRLVAKFDPADQREWLRRAAEAKWTSRKMAAEIEGDRGRHDARDATELGCQGTAARAAVPSQVRLTVEPGRLAIWQDAARTAGLEFSDWAASTLDQAARPSAGADRPDAAALIAA